MSRTNILVEGLVPTGLRTVSRKYTGENDPKRLRRKLAIR